MPPITRGEFEQERIDLAFPIARILAGLSDSAFTADEIRQMISETTARDAILEEVKQALQDLIDRERGTDE